MGILNIFNKKKQEREILKADDEVKKEELYYGRVVIFCAEEDLDKIMNVICDTFGISSSGNGNTLELHNGDINIYVNVTTAIMGDDAKAYIKEQVNPTYGHFYEVETEYIDNKTNVLYKIDATRGFVMITYSCNYENEDATTKMIMEMFASTLSELNGIILLNEEDDGLYCESDRGIELILSEEGKSTLPNYLPHEEFTMTPESGQVNEEQINRRLRNRKILQEKYIYVPAWYPLIETAEQSKCRSAEEIAKRAVALMIVSVYSECLLGDGMNVTESYEFVSGIIERFGAEEFFSIKEKEYLKNLNSTQDERVAHSWQYENLFVMEWALGLIDELDFPDHICDVPLIVRLLNNCDSIEEILKKSNPKSKESLLDECDLIFCLDWACVDTRIHRLPAPAGMDSGVVVERHKSLNWLVGYDESAEWDEVGTDT